MNWMRDLETTHEGRQLLERERVWFEATENLSRLMEESSVSKSELAKRLGTSKSWVTQLLSGTRNLTLGTLSDAFFVLGRSLHVSYGALTHSVHIVADDMKAIPLDAPEWPTQAAASPYSSRKTQLEEGGPTDGGLAA